jgi:mRNA interferase RelE/StbE
LPEVVLSREARETLAALPEQIRAAVLETIAALRIDPRAAGKPLLGQLAGQWVAVVGSYRVFFTIEESSRSTRVVVRRVRHRAAAYPRRRP